MSLYTYWKIIFPVIHPANEMLTQKCVKSYTCLSLPLRKGASRKRESHFKDIISFTPHLTFPLLASFKETQTLFLAQRLIFSLLPYKRGPNKLDKAIIHNHKVAGFFFLLTSLFSLRI